MVSLFNLLYIVGIFGAVGLVWALKVIRLITLARIAGSFWFRPPATPPQVIAKINDQQDCTEKQFTRGPKLASTSPATGSILSPGEEAKRITTIQTQETDRLNANLEELGKHLPAVVSEVARLSHLIETRITGPLQSGEVLLQQLNDKVDYIARKTNDIYQIISHGARSNDFEPPEAEVPRSDHYKGHSSEENTHTENTTPGNAHRTTGGKDSHISLMREEKLHRPASPSEADKNLVADAEDLVRALNALIEQISCIFACSLCYRESAISSKESEDLLNELICYIGPWLCNKLHSKLNTEHDRLMITQIVLQSGLVNACSHIVNHGLPPSDGATLSGTHCDTVTVETGTDTQKTQPPTNTVTNTSQNQDCHGETQKYLGRIALKLIAAVGGSLDSGGALPPRHSDVLDEIIKTSLKLHKAVSDATASMKLVTYTIPCNTDFDHSQMEDTEEGENETGHVTQDTVICSLEMGLRCRKRKESGFEEEWDIAMKTKVVLTNTLEV